MTTSVSLLEAQDLDDNTISKSLNTAKLSSQAYVLHLTSLPSYYAAAASAPSNQIDLFDRSTLQHTLTLPGHQKATTFLRAATSSGSNRPCLTSCGKDGTVATWDERTKVSGIQMINPGQQRPLLCCDVSVDGYTVAAGTELQGEDALIHYWDPRSPAVPVRTHAYTHSDDITAVHFYRGPLGPVKNTLLSASSDCLLSISNADEEDEDECVLHVGNWGCSIAQAGWIYGSSRPKIWAASDMETFSTWTNELDALQNLDIRLPSVHSHTRTWVTDYLITSHSDPNTSSGDLAVYVGSNEGDTALITCSDLSTMGASWTLHRIWTHGHQEIVRSLLRDEENNVLVTGGEDGKINVWPWTPLQYGSTSVKTESEDNAFMDIDNFSTSRKRDMDWEYTMDEKQEGKRARRG